jgi:hypothetical protein
LCAKRDEYTRLHVAPESVVVRTVPDDPTAIATEPLPCEMPYRADTVLLAASTQLAPLSEERYTLPEEPTAMTLVPSNVEISLSLRIEFEGEIAVQVSYPEEDEDVYTTLCSAVPDAKLEYRPAAYAF